MFKEIHIKRRYTLGSSERLKSRKLIGQLFNEGKSFSSGTVKGLYIISEESTDPLKCGFTVSSKTFKKAVDRNRVKRLMRECYRLQKPTLHQFLIDHKQTLSIFMIYRGKEIPSYSLLFETIGDVLKKLLKFANENISQDS